MAQNSSAQRMLQLRYRLLRQREHVSRWRRLFEAVCPFRFAAWIRRIAAQHTAVVHDDPRLFEALEPRVMLSSAVVSPVVPGAVVVTEVGPEIVVRGLKNRGVADNDNTPSQGNGTYFGGTSVGSSITRTFTIQNTGNQTLTLGDLEIVAANAADFECLTSPAQSILPGGATTFSIRFTPSATGTRFGAIRFTNNDSDENPFNFSIRGVGLAPEIAFDFGGTNLPDNDTTATVAEGNNFGNVEVGDFSDHTFTITNSGDGTLLLGAVEFAATHAADYSVVSGPDAAVAAGDSTTITIRFAPSDTGTRFGAFKIATNDNDENPFNFALRGTGVQAEIAVAGNGMEISTGDVTPNAADDTAWTNAPIGGFEDHTFTIRNDGTAPLDIGSVSVTGVGASRFNVISQPESLLAPGDTTDFTVRFSPINNLLQTAFVNFTNSDADESLYTFFISGLGEGDAEIDVDVDNVPATRGDTIDFGGLVLGDAAFTTLTIFNNGTDDLQITSVDIVGSDASDFAVIQSPDSVVAPGDSTEMIVQFFPGSVGSKFAGMRIFSNDADENPFNFALRGGVGTPEIAVDFGGQGIIDGDGTPSTLEGTDFGHIEVGDMVDRVFTIHNNGSAVLDINGITVVGNGFSILSQPAAQLDPGGSTTFTVRYAPVVGGTTNGGVSIFNSDSDESLFTFSLLGQAGFQEIAVTGTKSRPVIDGDISPSSGDGTNLGTVAVGQTASQTFVIHNVGTAALNITGVTITGADASDFAVISAPAAVVAAGGSTSVTIQGTASGGVSIATVEIANNDADENPYTFDVRIASTAPEANLFFNSPGLVPLADNDTSRTTANGTDFGTVAVGNSVDHTFTLANSGTQALTVGAVSIVGGGASEFSVVTQPATNVAASSNTTFTIRFTPTSNGAKFAGITFATNDANENPYNFGILGTGAAAVAPAEIDVSHMGTSLTDGDTTPSTAEGTDFGTIAVGTTVDRTFRIDNTGGQTLNIAGVSFVGANPGDFSVLTPPASSVAAGGNTTFTVRFTPSAALGRFAAMIINSDDADEAVFNVSITGQGQVGTGMPMVQVRGNGIGIPDDDVTPMASDGTDFGIADVTATFVNQEFTVTNVGGGTLSLSGLTINGPDSPDFTIPVGLSSSSLTAGQSATFTVRFNPSFVGVHNANIQLVTNDDNVAVFNAAIRGTGQNLTQQEVRTNFLSTTILDGDTTPSTGEGTDFGSTDIGMATQRTYTITNTGPAPSSLTLGTVTVSGAHPSDFSVISQPSGPLAGTQSSNFIVQFSPTATGVRSATISFTNNDADENPYNFAITGTGTGGIGAPSIQVDYLGTPLADGDNTPSAPEGTDYSAILVDGGFNTRTYDITNTGTGTLDLSGGITITGSDAADFSVTVQPGDTMLTQGESTSFTVEFDPSEAGTRFAVVNIASNDAVVHAHS